jgi:hypothetical protein
VGNFCGRSKRAFCALGCVFSLAYKSREGYAVKISNKLFLLIILIFALAWPQVALAQGPSGDKYVFGGSYTLRDGETLDGSLYVLGGTATLEEGSRVNGDVMLAGGTLRVGGRVEGDILATGGQVSVESTAYVNGDVTTLGANLDREPGAQITGEVNNGVTGPYHFNLPGGVRMPRFDIRFNPLWVALSILLWAFLWAALAILVVLFLPRQAERVAQAAVTQPLVAGGLGLLTAVVVPLLLVIVAITLIGIPISLLGALLLIVTWSFGLIALGTEVGKRLAQIFNQEWALAVAAGVGTFLLVFVVNSISKLVPCFGWLAPALVGVLGLGAVLLTRFGTQGYPPSAPMYPAPVTGDVPPPPPPTTPAVPERSDEFPVAPVDESIEEVPAAGTGAVGPEDGDRPREGGAQVFPTNPE